MNLALKPTCDRKTKFWDGQRNTFGLLPGPEGTCPMATQGPGGCRYIRPGRKLPECYVHKTMSVYKNVHGVLEHNTNLLKNATPQDKIRILSAEFKRFRDIEMKRDNPQLHYRLHWAGDIFDEDYLIALSAAMRDFPDIRFWAYTRSLPYVKWLANNTPNLTLYISLDPVNLYEGLQTYFDWANAKPRYNNVNLCYMSPVDNFAEQYATAYYRHQFAQIIHQYTQTTVGAHKDWATPEKLFKLRECPADTGKMPVEGSCAKCKGCTKEKPMAVWFKS